MEQALLFAGLLSVGMLACLEIGRRIGAARLARDPEGTRAGMAWSTCATA